MVVVEQKVRFDVFKDIKMVDRTPCIVTGTVYDVNYAHKVFHVEYEMAGTKQRTSFKFSDIGEKVRVV